MVAAPEAVLVRIKIHMMSMHLFQRGMGMMMIAESSGSLMVGCIPFPPCCLKALRIQIRIDYDYCVFYLASSDLISMFNVGASSTSTVSSVSLCIVHRDHMLSVSSSNTCSWKQKAIIVTTLGTSTRIGSSPLLQQMSLPGNSVGKIFGGDYSQFSFWSIDFSHIVKMESSTRVTESAVV
jgi:hypothetical protein